MIRLGFAQGLGVPNVFRLEFRQVMCAVHGDHVTSCGSAEELDWFETALAEGYALSIGYRLGPGPDDAKEARALNRIIRLHEGHFEYEADLRQAERLRDECGLCGAEPTSTSGLKTIV